MGEGGLVRGIGLRALTASVVNATVGAGIFVLPGTVGADLGVAGRDGVLPRLVASVHPRFYVLRRMRGGRGGAEQAGARRE